LISTTRPLVFITTLAKEVRECFIQ
jgi:hypothetical protein